MAIFAVNACERFMIFLHDTRWQYEALFEYGVIFGENLNLGLIRGLSRDVVLVSNFWIEIYQFFMHFSPNLKKKFKKFL